MQSRVPIEGFVILKNPPRVCQKVGKDIIYIYSSTQEIPWRVDLRFPLRLAGIELLFPIEN
ncbi:MAG TPA: hypothetical protein DCL81_17550 [Algoriphagus sp.]|nr:hypothetical protein [Algoriphagus sp.]HAH38229.1 hypothetical protein [Algoriphagus sp.]HAS58961.1 hypothetical protein [Algoriphagus sp.]